MFAVSLLLLVAVLLYGGVCVPRAILHIGPHKTSSSRIQGILMKLRRELIGVNYYLPHYKVHDSANSTDNPKGLANFAIALLQDSPDNVTAISHVTKFLAHSLHHNHNIILSSEAFDCLKLPQVARLKQMLEGYEVFIVFVYRDVLSKAVSLHFEFNRFEHEQVQFSTAFSAFMLNMMDNVPLRLRAVKTLSNYTSVFGAENLRIIDLHGTAAAKKEVTHVILCQVAGVLCNRSNFTDIAVGAFSNPSYSLIPAQVFSHLKAHVVKQNDGQCRFCDSLFNEYKHFAVRYANETEIHGPPANITTRLTLLVPWAQHVDAHLRDRYRHHFLEGNREENLKHMAAVKVQELDEDAFLGNDFWSDWIHSEHQNLLREGRLCNCTAA